MYKGNISKKESSTHQDIRRTYQDRIHGIKDRDLEVYANNCKRALTQSFLDIPEYVMHTESLYARIFLLAVTFMVYRQCTNSYTFFNFRS